jgi:DNA-3-methyladenine glycosylase
VARSSDPPPVDRAFFDRPTLTVARDLLGATFAVSGPTGTRSVRLVEVEAYRRGDPASHAFRGPTRRNRSMFASPGTVYVYRIHQVVCANLVTRVGEAVLLRAGAPLTEGLVNPSGPGRLCRALGITIADDGASAVEGVRFRLWARPSDAPRPRILRSTRIGISKGVERRYRFSVARDPWVSHRGRADPCASPRRSRGAGANPRSRTRRRRPAGGGTSGGRTAGR